MEDLIKIAEEQIKHLEEIQFSEVLDIDHIETSKEIRNWCNFIKEIKPSEKSEVYYRNHLIKNEIIENK